MPKILLVEDNEMNRDMLAWRLERNGFDVILALNGVEGLARAQTEHPDLILMDVSLPLLDGWEVTRRLRADANTQGIAIIALTAHVMAGDREKSLAAGCDDYEPKPVDFNQLLEKMITLLAK
jgi:two-component system, cell cycle response regulator DivK